MNEKRSFLILSFILFAGLLLRLFFLYQTDFVIDSDEAIVGLMAKHINEGKPWPFFYYGQDYMGSFEAILTSLVFQIAGKSSAALKIVPLLFSILQIWLVYRLASYFVERVPALFAAALCSFAPITLLLWSTKARGGFIEVVALGTIALIFSCEILKRKDSSARDLSKLVYGLGLSLGLGWWVNNQISYYMLPIGVILGTMFFIRFTVFEALKLGLKCLLAFFIGGFPFWYANIFGQPKWATFDVLFGGSGEVDVAEHFSGFFENALPIIMGARRFWSRENVFPFATSFFYSMYALGVFALLKQFFFSKERKAGVLLLLSFVTSVALIFSVSRFGWLSSAPRYILPLYSVSFVLLAVGFQFLRSSSFSFLSYPLFALMLLAQLSPLILSPGITVGQPFVFNGDRVAKNQSELYLWLEKNGYKHIFTNYWIGYRAAFETNEEITFSRFAEPLTLRIPEYELADEDKPAVYVLVPSQVEQFLSRLQLTGLSARRSEVGSYVVFDKIKPKWPIGAEIILTPEMLRASSRGEQVSKLIDSDVNTRWGSGEPQNPNMQFEIVFPKPNEISALFLYYGGFYHDAPRHLLIEAKKENGPWFQIVDLENTSSIQGFAAIGDATWEIYFEPVEIVGLRMRQVGSHPVFDWSIAELKVFEPAREKN